MAGQCSKTPRRQEDKVNHVRDYGAIGDGKVDDTAAIKAAIADLPKYGGVLHFTPGLYLLRERLVINNNQPITVRGDGIGVSRLVWDGGCGSSGLEIRQARGQHTNTDYTCVTRLSFWTRQLNKGTGLKVDLTGQVGNVHGQPQVLNRVNPRICIEHCEFRGENCCGQAWDVSLQLCNGLHSVISNVHIVGHTGGFTSAAGMLLDGAGCPTEVQISCCWVFNTIRALWITGALEGVKLSQCDFVGVGYGIYCEKCLQLSAVNCHINAESGCILARNVNQGMISNNLFYKMGAGRPGFGVQIEGIAAHNIVSNNCFVNITGNKAPMQGVVLGGNAHHCMVTGNIFANYGSGVVCGMGAQANLISNNMYDNAGFDKHNRVVQGDKSNRVLD